MIQEMSGSSSARAGPGLWPLIVVFASSEWPVGQRAVIVAIRAAQLRAALKPFVPRTIEAGPV